MLLARCIRKPVASNMVWDGETLSLAWRHHDHHESIDIHRCSQNGHVCLNSALHNFILHVHVRLRPRLRFITIILGRHRRRWVLPSFHHEPGRLSVHSKRRPYRFEIFSFQNYLDIPNIDGSVLNCGIAVANALETPQSLTKPSICVPG